MQLTRGQQVFEGAMRARNVEKLTRSMIWPDEKQSILYLHTIQRQVSSMLCVSTPEAKVLQRVGFNDCYTFACSTVLGCICVRLLAGIGLVDHSQTVNIVHRFVVFSPIKKV